MSKTDIDWDSVRKMSETITSDQAIRIIQNFNSYLTSKNKGTLIDIDTLLMLRNLRAKQAEGDVDAYDTSVKPEPDIPGKYPIVDIFHPISPGCVVGYEDLEGNLIEEHPENGKDSEVLRKRRAAKSPLSTSESKLE